MMKGRLEMTLLEYMNAHEGEEIAVHDVDYDMESYFYGGEPEDGWDRAMQKLAACLDVKEIESDDAVTVNLSELIENNLEKIKHLFIISTVDAIMVSMPAILSGNVSEKWMVDFADAIASTSCHTPEH